MSRRIAFRAESGQASAELMGALWWVLLAALGVWQILLATWTINEASNAARTGSRVIARQGSPAKAARNALTSGLRDGSRVLVRGDKVTVRVRVPLIFPGLSTDRWTVQRAAELPS
jgi:hypothetical protein